MDIISDKSSHASNFSNEIFWSDYLNLSFNTKIFSQNSNYIYELGNVYAAKNEIDEGLSEIIPNIKVYKRLASHIKRFIEALDMLKISTKRCVEDMENQRKAMYQVAKKLIKIRSKVESNLIATSNHQQSNDDKFS